MQRKGMRTRIARIQIPIGPGPPWFTEERARRWGWLIITLAVLVTYWPLSTFQYATDGGDTFDCWLAWRHFITLALKNGELPLWNPLQQMGYPVYADLQGPMWYPEALALGGTIGHSIWTLQALFLAYVIIGGIGFMRLCVTVHRESRSGLIAGLAYALCGFLVAHQMHFYAIISAAWMPWFLAAQLRLMRTPHWRTVVEAALCMMMMLTGGNHTFTIIAAYLLPFLFLSHVIGAWRHGDRKSIARLLTHELLFLGLTVVLACGTFYSWIEVSPYLGRMHGLPYELSSEGPFNPTALPTLLFPGLFGKNDWSIGTHPAMANGNMGALMLAFAIIALLRKRTATENIFAVFGIICALLSFAQDLPLHHFAWRWLPGLNVFRFPSYYLYFTMLGTLLLAAGSLKEDARWRWGRQRSFLIGTGCVLLVGTALLLFLPERFAPAPADALRRSLFEQVRAFGYGQRLFYGWMVTGSVVTVAFVLALRNRLTALVLLGVVFLEMGWNTHLCVWNTALSDIPPSVIHARLAQLPRGPVVPDLRPMIEHHDSGESLHYLWRNTQTFLGMPSREGFNSFWPSHTDSLINHHPELVEAMDKQPMVYLTDNLLHESHLGHLQPDSSTVFVPQMIRGGRLPRGTPAVPNDLHRSPEDLVAFTAFQYGRFALRTSTKAATFLVVQQTWFPGWTIRIDEVPAEVVRVNVAAFGALLPAGEHRVVVAFEKPLAPWLMGISMTAFFLALLILALSHSGPARALTVTGSVVVGGMIAWSLLAHHGQQDERARQHELNARLAPRPDDATLYSLPATPPMVLHAEHAYSPAFRTQVGDLLKGGHRSLVIDMDFEARGRCKGLLVFQRTLNGKTTEYEAVRFVSSDTLGRGTKTWALARDLAEFRFPEEELAIYAWNQGPDTLVIRNIHIRTSPYKVWP